MGSGLEHLLAEGVITEVLARLQSGKEAEVYVVRFGGRVVAAKVYKDRDFRSFKNNASYMEGRTMRSSRSQRAIDRGSRFGKAAAEDAWKAAEADALYKLHAAEVRVPTPVLFIDGVLLMELVVDGDGEPARRLIDTDLSVDQANAGYHDMLSQLVRILSCDLIHGDLSPYNVLWAAAGPTVIDFPQIVSASHNSSSERFFLRDAENVLGHFARIDRSLAARRSDAWEIWRAYVARELTPDFRPTGRTRQPPRFVAPQPPPRRQGAPAPAARPPVIAPPPSRPQHVAPAARQEGPRSQPDRRQHAGPRPSARGFPSAPGRAPGKKTTGGGPSDGRGGGPPQPPPRHGSQGRPPKGAPRQVEVLLRRHPPSHATSSGPPQLPGERGERGKAESAGEASDKAELRPTGAASVSPASNPNRADPSAAPSRRRRRRRRH